MKTTTENALYTSSDLALSSAIALWHPIRTIDKTDPRKAQFVFKHTADVDRLVESYWLGSLRVEPQAYFNQLRIIKARLYA